MKKLILLTILLSIPIFSQEVNHETKSEVQALTDLHEVIYKIWHTGWPEKDINLLSSLVPDVEKCYSDIKEAKLPGILRDKKPKWEEEVKNLGRCVEDYKNASAKNDSLGLLDAAERLHSKYEMLVRIIRPVLKEVDSFHQTLYMLYHYDVPNYNYEKIKTAAEEMLTKIDDLNKAQLSARMSSRKESFAKARMELEIAVRKFNEVVKTGNNRKAIETSVNLVHSRYEELENVFK